MRTKLTELSQQVNFLLGTHKSWWFNKDDGTFKGTNKSGPADGFEESLRLVEKTWLEGSFDGLLGFSQGGCFVGIISAMAELQKTSIRPSFVIICAGFQSGSLAHFNYTQERISIPALIVYGESDEIIPCGEEFLLNTLLCSFLTIISLFQKCPNYSRTSSKTSKSLNTLADTSSPHPRSISPSTISSCRTV